MHFVILPIPIVPTAVHIVKYSLTISLVLFHLSFVPCSWLICDCIYFSGLFLRFYWVCFLASFVYSWKKMYLWLISKPYGSFFWSDTIWLFCCNYIVHSFRNSWRIKVFAIWSLLALYWVRNVTLWILLFKFSWFDQILTVYGNIFLWSTLKLFQGTVLKRLMGRFNIF
jgi:hypothetical protein